MAVQRHEERLDPLDERRQVDLYVRQRLSVARLPVLRRIDKRLRFRSTGVTVRYSLLIAVNCAAKTNTAHIILRERPIMNQADISDR